MSKRPRQDASGETGDAGPAELRADVTRREDEPDECTIWPHDASGNALLTEWVTAEEGSFVPLPEMR